MKKSNVILQTAIASALLAMAGSACAQVSLTATSVAYATEQFNGTNAASVAVSAPTITVVAGTAITGNSIVTVAVKLNAGATWALQPSATNAALPASAPALGSTLTGTTAVAAGPGAATATANNADVFQVTFTLAAASSVGLGGTLFTLTTPSVYAANLATAAGTISATATVYQGAVTAPVGAAYTATVIDAASAATSLGTSAAGNTISVAANTSTSKIDLTATTASTLFTSVAASSTETASTTVYKLGRLYIKDNGSKGWDGATTWIAASNPAVTATIAAPAGFFAGLGSTGTVTLRDASGVVSGATISNACGGGVSNVAASATSTARTLAQTAADTSETITGTLNKGATTGSGWPYDICYNISGTVAQIEGTPTLAVSYGTSGVYTAVTTLAATNLQQLVRNGMTYDVRNYVPSGATGYTTFVRVINTGTLSAVVSAAVIDETTGTAGTAGTLGTLAAGAVVNYTSTAVEAATGAIVATARPRIRITAPTNALQVQTFLLSPNGNITDMTGAQ